MGTRADFYVGKGKDSEWLGSIAWDGYPKGGRIQSILETDSEDIYRAAVCIMFDDDRDDVTLPARGWPWPWDSSKTTDFAYTFDNGAVWISCFGSLWLEQSLFMAREKSDEQYEQEKEEFPDMTDRKNVTLGPRSGVMIISAPERNS